MANNPDYLGDGVYVDVDAAGQIVLTVSNGMTTSQPIYLERPVYAALRRYARRVWDKEPGDEG